MELLSASGGAAKAVLSRVTEPKCSLMLVTDGATSATTAFKVRGGIQKLQYHCYITLIYTEIQKYGKSACLSNSIPDFVIW